MPDFEGWAAFMADPEATRYLGGPQPRALAWRSFMTMAGAWHLQDFSMFSVIERGATTDRPRVQYPKIRRPHSSLD
jgi:RimJ/RimL family protein N-acetyltransferase